MLVGLSLKKLPNFCGRGGGLHGREVMMMVVSSKACVLVKSIRVQPFGPFALAKIRIRTHNKT